MHLSPSGTEVAMHGMDSPMNLSANRDERASPSILVVLSSLCAEGTPILALELCRWWRARGVSPVIATISDRPRHLAPELRALGVEILSLGLSDAPGLRFPSLWYAIYRLCRERKFEAVLSMPLGWHGFTFSAARAAGIFHTAVHVGNYPTDPSSAAFAKFRFLVHLARPFTGSLICCSSHIQRGTIELFGIPEKETTLVYNGVNVDAMAERAATSRAARTRDRFVVGTVATFEIHKDQPTLIRAVGILREAGIPVELWLIGDGSRRTEYEALISDLGLNEHVKLLGVRRDVPELLGRMDLFVFSAKEDEGHPVALVEAMAAGVPILSTNVTPCREALGGEDKAHLVPPADPRAMADAIAEHVAAPDSPLWTERVARAQRRAQEAFSLDAMARAYSSLLGLRLD